MYFPVFLTLMLALSSAFSAPSFSADLPQRPLVVVPGILGSKLCTESDEIVWGTGSSLRKFSRLQLDGDRPEKLVKCGLIDQVEVLGPLYSVKAYKSLLKDIKDMGFGEQQPLLLFDYDWRQSNSKTAELFAEFIADNKRRGVLRGKFDVVAHSMGGIVTRLYMQSTPGHQINKVIYLGTPFLGSANTLGTLSEGWGFFQNLMAGGMEQIREVIVSLPGFLELLPRYSNCCYVRNANGSRRDFDVFSGAEWKSLGWLPAAVANDPVRFAAFSGRLMRAKALTATLSTPSTGATELRFVGDAHPTRVYFGMKAGATSPDAQNWLFTKDRGDGTVPAWSAARNPSFRDLSTSHVSFSEHATIFDDDSVRAGLKWELLAISPERREPISGRGHPVISVVTEGSQRNWTITALGFESLAASYRVGTTLSGKIVVQLDGSTSGLRAGLVRPSMALRQSDISRTIDVSETTTAGDVANRRLVFAFDAGSHDLRDGVAELEFSLPSVRSDAKAVARVALLQ